MMNWSTLDSAAASRSPRTSTVLKEVRIAVCICEEGVVGRGSVQQER